MRQLRRYQSTYQSTVGQRGRRLFTQINRELNAPDAPANVCAKKKSARAVSVATPNGATRKTTREAMQREVDLPALPLRRRDARLVEALRVHDVDLPHQDVGRDLVFGAAKLAEGGQQSQVVERLDRQG